MSATYGETVRLTIFGESHGKGIGLVLDGVPAGTPVDEDFIRSEMARRAPGQNLMSTQRKETDAFIIESGVFEGRAAGTPICVLIPNSDQHSKDYSILKDTMRPGHADYAGKVKYRGYNDYRGGGHFSGRLTAPLVWAGALAKTVLAKEGILIGAHIARLADVTDKAFDPMGEKAETLLALRTHVLPTLDADAAPRMEAAVLAAREALDSVGGVVEVMVTGLPAGLGDPFFDSLESRLAHALFSVPAVKGLEFGDGFGIAALRDSQANDAMHYEGGTVKTLTNHNGGITGGITNGMPVVFRAAVKPTPSIARPQRTVNLAEGRDTVLEIKGRHDPCIVPRAVPVLEAVTAWTLWDVLLCGQRGDRDTL